MGLPVIDEFLGRSPLNIVFIPFAAVNISYEAYGQIASPAFDSIGHTILVAEHNTAAELIKEADVIVIGGGNTFKLLHDLYDLNLVELIREKVNSGTAYIGWSAGSNIVGKTIGTTNDMPVIEPESFKAINLWSFQINPHYSNYKPEGFNGETRDQRLEEFALVNPGTPIICLPEGTALKEENNQLLFVGHLDGISFLRKNNAATEKNTIAQNSDLSYLLSK